MKSHFSHWACPSLTVAKENRNFTTDQKKHAKSKQIQSLQVLQKDKIVKEAPYITKQ